MVTRLSRGEHNACKLSLGQRRKRSQLRKVHIVPIARLPGVKYMRGGTNMSRDAYSNHMKKFYVSIFFFTESYSKNFLSENFNSRDRLNEWNVSFDVIHFYSCILGTKFVIVQYLRPSRERKAFH